MVTLLLVAMQLCFVCPNCKQQLHEVVTHVLTRLGGRARLDGGPGSSAGTLLLLPALERLPGLHKGAFL